MSLVIDGKANAYITPATVHIVGYWLAKAYGAEKAKQLLLIQSEYTRDKNAHCRMLFAQSTSVRSYKKYCIFV